MSAPPTVCSLLCAISLAACVSPPPKPPRETSGQPVTSEAEAIAIVTASIREEGGDPERSEWSAMRIDGDWHVTGWRIMYPENGGSSRFVPGGFTSYTVADNGEILAERPGH